MPFHLMELDKGRLLALKESGLSNKACARALGRDVRCVRRWWKYEENGEAGMAKRKGTGRPQCTNDEEDAAMATVNSLYVTDRYWASE